MNDKSKTDMAKSKYEENFPARVEAMAKDGLLEKDMAAMLGVSVETFEHYKKTREGFLESLKAGKIVIDHKVENKLLNAAMGFEYKETKVITNEDGSVRTEVTTKQSLPNITAQIFWLKNRQPQLWRDVSRVEYLDLRKALDKGKPDLMVQGDKRVTKAIEADYSVLIDAPLESATTE
jgi:hypothetical protein